MTVLTIKGKGQLSELTILQSLTFPVICQHRCNTTTNHVQSESSTALTTVSELIIPDFSYLLLIPPHFQVHMYMVII